MMQSDETPAGERQETITTLVDLLSVLQGMGHRLSYETHGESFDSVKEFNEILHQAHEKIMQIHSAQL
jgi:hypothetical protein